MSYIPSETTTCYGTVVKRILDTNREFPVVKREYIPSTGSKFKKLGFEKITRIKSPAQELDFCSVIRNGKRKNYSIQELKEFLKELNIQEVFGHRAKEVIRQLKK